MVSNLDISLQQNRSVFSDLLLEHTAVKTCHISLPDMPKPVGAIAYDNRFYSYVKFYPTLEAAQRASDRMKKLGNLFILTRVPKGLVLWVFEPDAQLAK
ncbi:hypothetical protein K9N68_17810 [Kovacikia minuta CCNUW1]|uniref:hypothetical protein n=1 Tax=Kovacikia minuta TaxID=2931930 RepID=UPI001CCF84AF|nr:hypothetical protein [Kovacikia minuta]UBF23632.1 hypothetical protein K9N68_17810 [Kovacikia minuta CCNUW1]